MRDVIPRLSEYNFNVSVVELGSAIRNIKEVRFPKPMRGNKINGVTFSATKKAKVLVTHGKRLREVAEDDITFTEEDADGLMLPRNDALRLEATKGKWPEKLLGVLWAYRITVKSSTRKTPFSLVYGAEALIPMEVGEPTLRYFQMNEETNNKAILVKLELLDERRDLGAHKDGSLKAENGKILQSKIQSDISK
uniref:Uncharacterized protein LOC104223124 n=1 Tax=Nicotiana sylvestris TaxID=4096 RepID=A0A1U7VYE6_NICSY|nr:PREDICTED: uncharacterized protein LOC104223124 [Nicotiana sylvestris]